VSLRFYRPVLLGWVSWLPSVSQWLPIPALYGSGVLALSPSRFSDPVLRGSVFWPFFFFFSFFPVFSGPCTGWVSWLPSVSQWLPIPALYGSGVLALSPSRFSDPVLRGSVFWPFFFFFSFFPVFSGPCTGFSGFFFNITNPTWLVDLGQVEVKLVSPSQCALLPRVKNKWLAQKESLKH
jgi:hypothetical protein